MECILLLLCSLLLPCCLFAVAIGVLRGSLLAHVGSSNAGSSLAQALHACTSRAAELCEQKPDKCAACLFALASSQAAAIPPAEWLWRNVYVHPENMDMRTVQGSYVQPTYDPTYSS